MGVLVTGASGLLGGWLLRTVPASIDAVAATHTSLVDWPDRVRSDLRDRRQAREVVRTARPELVIHAAYHRDRASIVEATRNVLAAAEGTGATVALVSTDAVFSGDGHPRAEDDEPDPVWDYGRWKLEAERLTAQASPPAVIVRLPLLVSFDPPDGTTRRVQEAAARGKTVGWHVGERRQPAYAWEVADALWRLVRTPMHRARGVWHLPGPERLTRAALGARIAASLGVADPGIAVPPPVDEPRPLDRHLTCARAREHLGWDPTPVLSDVEPPD